MAVVSVFVSSTFRDFHGERDVLVGPVRETLDERLRPLGCRVEFVDLRWGVAAGDPDLDRETRQRRVLDVCLTEIARSRPLFVGLIGDRYGWVPPEGRARRVAAEAGLSVDVAGRSVTELEFLHGALQQTEAVTPVFFLRQLTGPVPAGWRAPNPAQADKLAALRRRVRAHPDVLVHEYTSDVDGERITDLSGFESLAVAVLGPEVQERARALLEEEVGADPADAPERLFLNERTAVVAGRDELLEWLSATVVAGTSVCLTGPSGVGKSALWCTLVQGLREHGVRVAAVPVGAAPGVTSELVVVTRLAAQLGTAVPAEVESTEDLRDWWRTTLADKTPVVIAVDGLDGLDAGAAREELGFLAGLPDGVTRLTSTTLERHAALLARTGVEEQPVGDLLAAAVRDAVAALMSRARRELPAEAINVLASRDRSPLWLSLAVGELNALDEDDFTGLDPTADPIDELTRLVTHVVTALPSDTAGLIDSIATRAERRFGPAAVAAIIQPLALSRSGLPPADLASITGLGEVVVAGVRRAFSGLIENRGSAGRVGFVHGIAHRVLRDRYVGTDVSAVRGINAAIAECLAAADDGDQTHRDDLLWHTLHCDGVPSAAPILNAIPIADALGRGEHELAAVKCAVQVASAALLDEAVDFGRVTEGLNRNGFLVLLATLHTVGHTANVNRVRHLAKVAAGFAARRFDANPDSAQAASDFGIALSSAGSVAELSGDAAAARVLYKASLGLATAGTNQRPNGDGSALGADGVRVKQAGTALADLGRRAFADGDTGRARSCFEKSLELRRVLYEWVESQDASVSTPFKLGAASEMIDSLQELGKILESGAVEAMRIGRSHRNSVAAFAEVVRAGRCFDEALQIARELWEADRRSPSSARQVMWALAHRAGWNERWRTASRDLADELSEERLQIGRDILRSYPTDRPTVYAVAEALTSMARRSLNRGHMEQARKLAEESVQMMRRVSNGAAKDSANAVEAGVLVNGLLVQADLAHGERDFSKELSVLRGAAGVLSPLSVQILDVGLLKDAVRQRLVDLARTALEAGQDLNAGCLSALQKLGSSPSLLAEIAQRRRDAHAANPEGLQPALDLVGALMKLADATPKYRRAPICDEAVELARQLHRNSPDHPGPQRCLAFVLSKQGRLSQEVGDTARARGIFEESAVIARRLVLVAGPDDLPAARGLSLALSLLWTCDREEQDPRAEAVHLVELAQVILGFDASEFPVRDAVRGRLGELATDLAGSDTALADLCRGAAESLN